MPDPDVPEEPAPDGSGGCDERDARVECDELGGGVLERCVRDDVPAPFDEPDATGDELPDVSTRAVSTMSTTSAITEARKANRRRQYTEGGWSPTG